MGDVVPREVFGSGGGGGGLLLESFWSPPRPEPQAWAAVCVLTV